MLSKYIILALCFFSSQQSIFAQVQVSTMLTDEKTVFIGGQSTISPGGAYIARSVDNGMTWQNVSAGFSASFLRGMTMLEDVLIVGTEDGIRRSDDKGSRWHKITSGLPKEQLTGVIAIGTSVLASSLQGMYRSDDKGITWQQTNEGLPKDAKIPEGGIAILGSAVCIGTIGSGVFISHDAGKTWLPMNAGLEHVDPFTKKIEPDFVISTLSVAGTTVHAMTFGYGNRYRWNTTEKRWQLFARDDGAAFPWVLTSIEGRIVLGGIHHRETIFLSDDDGFTFYASPLPNTNQAHSVFSLAANKTAVFAAAPLVGVFRSLDKGNTWHQVFPQRTTVVRFAPDEQFRLRVQPNPARENASMLYRLPQSAHVRISLINSLGQRVAILHDAHQNAGEHSMEVDVSRYAAGVYAVRVEAGSHTSQTNIVVLP